MTAKATAATVRVMFDDLSSSAAKPPSGAPVSWAGTTDAPECRRPEANMYGNIENSKKIAIADFALNTDVPICHGANAM